MTEIERLSGRGILRRGSKRRGFRYVYARGGKSARSHAARIDARLIVVEAYLVANAAISRRRR